MSVGVGVGVVDVVGWEVGWEVGATRGWRDGVEGS